MTRHSNRMTTANDSAAYSSRRPIVQPRAVAMQRTSHCEAVRPRVSRLRSQSMAAQRQVYRGDLRHQTAAADHSTRHSAESPRCAALLPPLGLQPAAFTRTVRDRSMDTAATSSARIHRIRRQLCRPVAAALGHVSAAPSLSSILASLGRSAAVTAGHGRAA